MSATITMQSLTTDQGTAMPESTLCTIHQSDADRAYVESIAQPDAARPFLWVDSSDNDAVECAVCGTLSGAPMPVPHMAVLTFTAAPDDAAATVESLRHGIADSDAYPTLTRWSLDGPTPLVPAPVGDALNAVIDADQFMAFMVTHVQHEAVFTEENNETRSLGDYLADLHRRLTVMQGLDDAAPAKAWPQDDDEQERFEDWQAEVANGDTISGFRDWLTNNPTEKD